MNHRWIWPARCIKVIDGDTIDVEIDCGFNTRRIERLRLANINTPEMRGPTREAGVRAMTETIRWMHANDEYFGFRLRPEGWPLTVETFKADAFGRYIAIVTTVDGRSLNDYLITAGHAVPFMEGRGQ
jgi:micrococcal nuclease